MHGVRKAIRSGSDSGDEPEGVRSGVPPREAEKAGKGTTPGDSGRVSGRGEGAAAGLSCASRAKVLKLQIEIAEIVADAFRRSRTGFERDLRRIVLKIRPFMTVEQAGGGP